MDVPHKLILYYVLHVPRLFVNLVLIQRIAKLDEYRIIFDDLDVFLYNKVQGWRTRLSKVYDGLYYLHDTHIDTVKALETKVTLVSTNSTAEKIHLLKRRLGHPSFSTLKNMYPNLFGKLSLENFICEACQLPQLKRNTYLLENN